MPDYTSYGIVLKRIFPGMPREIMQATVHESKKLSNADIQLQLKLQADFVRITFYQRN